MTVAVYLPAEYDRLKLLKPGHHARVRHDNYRTVLLSEDHGKRYRIVKDPEPRQVGRTFTPSQATEFVRGRFTGSQEATA